ncbi:protoporphyrinogen/coproporphyrinogen oxidase [Streptomyces sp. NPDC002536]
MSGPAAAGHVIVIGGGMAGLAAAHRLGATGRRVTVLESTARLGGKLHTGDIAGVPVDFGTEGLPARRPEAVDLARAVGLGDRLRFPAVTPVALWSGDALRPLPRGHGTGTPGDPAALADALSPAGALRTVRRRPPVAAPASAGPAVMGLDGGAGALADAVAGAVRAAGGQVFLCTPALALTRTADGWEVRTAARTLVCDAVVIAAPAWTASTLVAAAAPAAAAELCEIGYVSTAVVTMAFRRREVAGLAALGDWSGFLVPPAAGRPGGAPGTASIKASIKASTFMTAKWGWVAGRAPDLFVLRTSLGRYGQEESLYLDDDDLVGASLHDLRAATGLAARPVAAQVTRWIGGLPRYPVGHRARVARIREALGGLPGLEICGAAYDGVGVADCVASGRRAADGITGPEN